MGLNILIVEDEAVIGLLLGEVLAEMGHQVCGIAATATEAIAVATMHRPDLMIVDINLAGKNGSADVADLRAQSPTPCLLVGGDENILEVFAGRGDALVKRYQPQQSEIAIMRELIAALA
ncbi:MULTISPECIES: response regulator [Sphingosinicellaceae]|uniref:response regulator n=1 Tax=Sphingosinicellaceae TaxID=2820280 RepID=UPI001C1E6550|nr:MULTISPECIES: response regulator [Polymorphobacter]QYE33442.1 response regulator [Polymorphobacter sp. PAMC 29334]UAJ12808.1 response regulator [Polymorphobacter megasporae]